MLILAKGGGTLVNFSLLKLLKPAYDDSFVMVRALVSTRNEPSHPVGRTRAWLSICPSPQKIPPDLLQWASQKKGYRTIFNSYVASTTHEVFFL